MAPVKKPQPSTSRTRNTARKSTTTGPSKSKSKDTPKRPPPKQVKTKPGSAKQASNPTKKKSRYTEAQLSLPALNAITPAHATAKSGRGAGKKKNKIYVDDAESMMTILAMVNAEKEGAIESKVLKARRMEEIREARRVEMEKRREGKVEVLEGVKRELKRKGRKREGDGEGKGKKDEVDDGGETVGTKTKKRKSVSFA